MEDCFRMTPAFPDSTLLCPFLSSASLFPGAPAETFKNEAQHHASKAAAVVPSLGTPMSSRKRMIPPSGQVSGCSFGVWRGHWREEGILGSEPRGVSSTVPELFCPAVESTCGRWVKHECRWGQDYSL